MSVERRIQEVLARYVRATDRRDGAAQGALFTDDAVVQLFSKTGPDSYEPVGGPLVGGGAVKYAVENFMEPVPTRGASHHLTSDYLIEVDGDRAHLNAQFIVFHTLGDERPAGGWPQGTFGPQGSVRAAESGYYDSDLRLIDGQWRITRHHILLDLPMALPGA